MARPTVGVLLAGCGVYDGAEIHEAVLTLLALDRAGARAVCMAPNAPQLHVVNHLTGEVTGETRNVLVEAARIARGQISDLASVSATDLDALVLPGGFGAAKNLCDFAVKGTDCAVHPEVARLVREVHAQEKPIGAICIAPAVIARVLGADQPRLTIGDDAGTAAALTAMGASHVACGTDGIVVDRERRIVTTPAYMLAGWVAETAVGIERLVAEVLAMVEEPVPAA
jgi:enhancing lycopene biosynthesis protein 2